MSLYTKLHEIENTGKPIAVFIFPREFEKVQHITGFGIPILEYVSQDYHPVIITGDTCDITYFKKYGDVWGLSNRYFKQIKEKRFKRAVEMKDSNDSNWNYNQSILTEEIEKTFGSDYLANLSKIFIITAADFKLPMTTYVSKDINKTLYTRKNEFHDSISTDIEEHSIINEYAKKVNEKIHLKCSVLAFSSQHNGISMTLVNWMFLQSSKFEHL